VNGRRRERWQADRDVIRAVRTGRAVADPFAWSGDDGLARVHIERSAVVLDADIDVAGGR